MSNPKKQSSSGSKSSAKGFSNDQKTTQQESSISELESTVLETALPTLYSTENKAISFTFEAAMLHLQVSALTEVINEGGIQSDVLSRIDRIKQENEEAKQDWGPVEEKAYERLLEGSTKNVSAQKFLNWLSELEQGHDV